jgi:hypothetical protein
MHCIRLIALLAAVCLASHAAPPAARAQAANPDALTVPRAQAGETYRRAVRGGRVRTDLVYLKPEADESLPTETPEPQRELAWPDLNWNRIVTIAVTVMILVAIAVFAMRFAPRTTISMSAPEDSARRDRRRRRDGTSPTATAADGAVGPDFLDRLRAMPDRKQALILLLRRALERALEIHGMTLGRSQTAREILRKLPRSWDHYAALSRLVGFEERVQFGGRDLPEPVFQESLSLAEPLFIQGAGA